MHALRNLLIPQLLSWLVIGLVLRGLGVAVSPQDGLGLAGVFGAQALLAAGISRRFFGEQWWVYIHLGFSPLLALLQPLHIPAEAFLVGFLLLALVYWGTFQTRVPLFLSNQRTLRIVLDILTIQPPRRFLDLGCGTGTVLLPVARHFPQAECVGIECAPAPYLISRLRSLTCPNVRLLREDFWASDWSAYDVVYAFLSPVPMPQVWQKALQELPAGALLISNTFPIPEIAPRQIVHVDDARRTQLYLYWLDDYRTASANPFIKDFS